MQQNTRGAEFMLMQIETTKQTRLFFQCSRLFQCFGNFLKRSYCAVINLTHLHFPIWSSLVLLVLQHSCFSVGSEEPLRTMWRDANKTDKTHKHNTLCYFPPLPHSAQVHWRLSSNISCSHLSLRKQKPVNITRQRHTEVVKCAGDEELLQKGKLGFGLSKMCLFI